jgi:hypothetical protein
VRRLHDRPMSRGRLIRRGYPIIGYVGANGHGKTMAMVHDTMPTLDSGRRVLSTVRLLDWRNPRPCDDELCVDPAHPDHMAAHPLYERFHDYGQLLTAVNCDILMDEVTGVASSRESQSMPVQVANFLVQLRRRNVRLAWSAPAWARADIVIRECTQAVVVCTGSMGKSRPTPEGESPRLWFDNRLFNLSTYDAVAMEEFHLRQAEDIDALSRQMFWRPGSEVDTAYDTLDPVSALGWAQESGMCMVCGGKRAIPRCSCGQDHGEGPRRSRSGVGAPRVRSSGGDADTGEGSPDWVSVDSPISLPHAASLHLA